MATIEQLPTHSATRDTPLEAKCDPSTRVTRSLLGYGVLSGILFTVVWLGQALGRRGFSLRTDAASLLANGHLGWIQSVNFLVSGAMVIAAAAGIRRAIGDTRTELWAARLIAVYGLGVAAAGVFRADPMDGFPPGTPAGAATHTSWHGNLHFLVGGIGFLGLIAAALLFSRLFTRRTRPSWASASAATGVIFLAANVIAGVVSTHHEAASNLTLTAGVVLAWAWLAAISIHLYRSLSPDPTTT